MVRAKPAFAAMGATVALMILGLWTGGGCTQSQKARPGTLSRWEQQLGWNRPQAFPDAHLNRRVAGTAPRCLKDRIRDPQFLRQEVARLEEQWKGVPVNDSWGNVNLATLPPSQAEFLSSNDRWIATENDFGKLDFSSCSDVPCILNRVYGFNASDQGWKVYYFYLATGYTLSCSRFVPIMPTKLWNDWQDKLGASRRFGTAPMSQFLFTDTQLTSFWKLSYLLPGSYRRMKSLDWFHRVPAGYSPEDKEWDSTVCGDSEGLKEHGYIRLARCLDEDNGGLVYEGDDPNLQDNGIRGIFYLTVAHEMTHSWDRLNSPSERMENGTLYEVPLSETAAWMKYSGWFDQTVTRPKGSDVVIERSKWARHNREGFVRDYAATSPNEDFAETAAWVRFRPELAAKRSGDKARYLSNLIFGGRTYDADGLARYYEDEAVRLLKSDSGLEKLAQQCLDQKGGAQAPTATTACMERGLNDAIDAAFDDLRGREWEACDQLEARDSEIRHRVFSRVNADVAAALSETIDLDRVLKGAEQLRSALASQVDPRAGYEHCYRQARPEDCYRQAVSDGFDRVAQPFAAQLESKLPSEKAAYLAQHSFEHSREESTLSYQKILAGIEPKVMAVADARWQSCLGAPVPAAPAPVVYPFSGGAHFVAASILNCINSAYAEDLRKVRDDFLAARSGGSGQDLAVSDPDAQTLIQDLLLPGYLGELNSKEQAAAQAEDQERARRESGVLDVLSAELLRDKSWFDGAQTSSAAGDLCAEAAGTAFDSYFGRVSQSEQIPVRFEAIRNVRMQWSQGACTRVMTDPAIAQALNERSTQAWNKAVSVLQLAISTRAHDTAVDCVARNRSSRSQPAQSLRARRRHCLVSHANWSMVEAQALVDWDQTPEGHAYSSHRAEAQAYLSAHRSALQAAAIRSMESH
jgi:hypothetical protein